MLHVNLSLSASELLNDLVNNIFIRNGRPAFDKTYPVGEEDRLELSSSCLLHFGCSSNVVFLLESVCRTWSLPAWVLSQTSLLTPASNSAIRCGGRHDSISHVAIEDSFPSHTTCKVNNVNVGG